ncbi:hypothetical protein AB0M50_25305 [Nonomuraea fuscirosea]|jgi:hypothetical protein|uniref:hypothetical protein n=1 Tax=Nonomuraea fuscirosea TaxID=1291556 RepID=UPI00343B4A48
MKNAFPAFCRGLAVIESGDGVVIDGGPRRYLFSGTWATTSLAHLIRALDGAHTVTDLCADLNLPEGDLRKALRLLAERGLLETYDEPRAPEPVTSDEQVGLYHSRTFSAMREVHDNAEQLMRTLADAMVLVLGEGAIAEAVMKDLRGNGVHGVRAVETVDGMGDEVGTRKADLVLVDDSVGGSRLSAAWQACVQAGIPLLRYACSGETAEVGPLFHADVTACVECFRAAEPVARGERPVAGRAEEELLAALVCTEVISILGRFGARRTHKGMSRFRFRDLDEEGFHLVPEYGCANCGTGMPASAEAFNVAAYEGREEFVPAVINPLRSIPSPRGAERTRRGSIRAELPYAPTLVLPQPSGNGLPYPFPASAAGEKGLGQRVLGSILAEAASGLREAAIGGVPSVELYVTCPGGTFALPGDLFKYTDTTRSLTAVRATEIGMARLLDGVAFPPGPEPEVVVFTVAALKGLKERHHTSAHRIALLDGGYAAMRLATVVDAFGLSARFAHSWPRDVGSRLELYPNDEFVTSIAAVEGTPLRKEHSCH